MAKNAVVKINHFQYNVEEGGEYTVPKIVGEVGSKMKIEEVILAGEGDSVKLGTPFLEKAVVEIEILSQEKGEKVTTRVYKAKSRYRRTKGFRKEVTKFKVNSIKF